LKAAELADWSPVTEKARHGCEHRRLVEKEGQRSRPSIAEFIDSKEFDFGFQGLASQAELDGCASWAADPARAFCQCPLDQFTLVDAHGGVERNGWVRS
jgi:hypothetical protein